MGNMQCPAEDAALLASVARDVCPFPDYTPNPLFFNMLSINSSRHLSDHYTAMQSSLNPKQLEDFTQSLRSTFGREGRVSYGGVGVVALSLAVLFDTLAKQVKGEWVSDSGPIPGLFLKDLRGFYPPHVHTISEYLRLVPHIANNPTRMKEETERYIKKLRDARRSLSKDGIAGTNGMLGEIFLKSLRIHLHRIRNSTLVPGMVKPGQGLKNPPGSAADTDGAHISKARKKRIPAPEKTVLFNFNCDPDSASIDYLAEVHKSNGTHEAFEKCHTNRIPLTWLHYTARLAWLDVINSPLANFEGNEYLLEAQRGDFDLKANALGKWA